MIEENTTSSDFVVNSNSTSVPNNGCAKIEVTHQQNDFTKIFTNEEDQILRELVGQYKQNWEQISEIIATKTPKQCRERWKNYLNPAISTWKWTNVEDELLIERYMKVGPQWDDFRFLFPDRSNNDIRNRWIKLQNQIKNRTLKIDSKILGYLNIYGNDTPPVKPETTPTEKKPQEKKPPEKSSDIFMQFENDNKVDLFVDHEHDQKSFFSMMEFYY